MIHIFSLLAGFALLHLKQLGKNYTGEPHRGGARDPPDVQNRSTLVKNDRNTPLRRDLKNFKKRAWRQHETVPSGSQGAEHVVVLC